MSQRFAFNLVPNLSKRGFSSSLNKFEALSVPFSKLESSQKDSDLLEKIEKSFSAKGLGTIVVSEIPGYQDLRKKLLAEAYKLHQLPAKTLEELSKPESFYLIGYNPGGSFIVDGAEYDVYSKAFFSFPFSPGKVPFPFGSFHENVWPDKDLPLLRPLITEMANLMHESSEHLGRHIDFYIQEKTQIKDQRHSIEQIVKNSRHVSFSKLIHYTPMNPNNHQLWQGWHRDPGILTVLGSQQFTNDTGEEVLAVDPTTGLHVENLQTYERGLFPFGEDSIAIQAGEQIQILSGGLIQALPHAVIANNDGKRVGRNVAIYFVQTPYDLVMDVPTGMEQKNVYEGIDPEKRYAPIEERWFPGQTAVNFYETWIKHFSMSP